MKKYFVFFVFLVFLSPQLLAATANFQPKINQKTEAVIIEAPADRLLLGEKLHFEVSWMGFNVGFGEIHVKEKVLVNGRLAYHIIATARTNDFLSKIYPVHDEIHSWIDTDTFYSLKFRKTLREGRYRADEEVEFKPDQKKGFYRSYKNGTQKEFKISGPVHDIVSAFYWFRLQNVAAGGSVHTIVSSEEQDWDVEIKALSVQNKEIRGLGSVGTIRVEPKTSLKGALYDRGRVWVYFTADEYRVPVWVVFKTPFGPVNGVLKVN